MTEAFPVVVIIRVDISGHMPSIGFNCIVPALFALDVEFHNSRVLVDIEYKSAGFERRVCQKRRRSGSSDGVTGLRKAMQGLLNFHSGFCCELGFFFCFS